jgi:hypothetical protein
MAWVGDRVLGWTTGSLVSYTPATDEWTTIGDHRFGELGSVGKGVSTGTDLWFVWDQTVHAHLTPTAGLTTMAPAPFRPDTATWTGSRVLITANDWQRGGVRVAQFDPATAVWREGARGPAYVNNALAVFAGDRFVAQEWGTGGPATVDPTDPTSRLPPKPPSGLAYDPARDTWSVIPAVPRAANPVFAEHGLVVWSEEQGVGGSSTVRAITWTPPAPS